MDILKIIPPILTIIIALKTKKQLSSLLIGAVACCVIQYGTEFVGGLIDLMYGVGCSEDTVWYVLFVSFFGCLLGIWTNTGATDALTMYLSRVATNRKRTLLISFLLSIILCIDDLTSLMTRATMRPLYNKNKIPRGEASFIGQATSSTVCSLVPFGTWGVFYISVFAGFDEINALGSGMGLYMKVIPWTLFSWVLIVIAFLFVLGVIKPYGRMKRASQTAMETGRLYSEASEHLNTEDANIEDIDSVKAKKLITGLLIPLISYIVFVVLTGDSLLGVLVAVVMAIVLFLVLRLSSWTKLMEACMNGMADMVGMLVIIFGAYMLRDGLSLIGLADYVISIVEPFMIPAILPAITFIVLSVLGFLSSAGWGMSLPVLAIVVPLCSALGANMYMVLGAIVSGAAFTLSTCFYCDMTVFTASVFKIDTMEHSLGQLPYNLAAAGITTVLFLIAGFVF